MTPPPADVPGAGRRRALAFLAVLLLAAYAPLVAVARAGVSGVFELLADDAFYYLAIADQSPAGGPYTFDGVRPTNGFHPVWQGALTLAFRALELGSEGQILFAFTLSLLLMALGTALFGVVVLRLTESVSLTLLACVPGIYWWIAPATSLRVGAQWSFANGMESALSVLCFGVLAWLLIERRVLGAGPRRIEIAGISLLLTLSTLTRLDDVFLFAPFFVWLALRSRSRGDFLRHGVALSVAPLLLIGGYLLWSLHSVGAALPVSGAEKSGGPVGSLLRNGYAVLTTLFPYADTRHWPASVWGAEAWRVTQMAIPALAALVWLWLFAPRLRRDAAWEESHGHAMLALLALYVVLKAAFNFAFVGVWHQGHWYYPLSIMICNAIVATLLAQRLRVADVGDRLPGVRLGGRTLELRSLAPFGCAALVLFAGNVFANAPVSGGAAANFAFWSQRASIERALEERCLGCGILSFDDGIVAYSLSNPTTNGLGLAIDPVGLEAKRGGRLLTLAYGRGARLLVSVNYPIAAEFDDATSLRGRLARYRHLRNEDLGPWHFEIAYRDPASGALFIRFAAWGLTGDRPPAGWSSPDALR